MKTKFILLLLVAAGAGAVWFWKFNPPPATKAPSSASSPKAERKILYYQSFMHPWIKSDKPGKCPICGMDLVPVYEDSDTTNSISGIKLKPGSVTVLNVQTATVSRQPFVHTLRVAGSIVGNSSTAAWFEFIAYERDFTCLKVGQTIEVGIPAAPGKTYLAKLNLHSSKPIVDTDFDTASGSTKVRAEISNPPVEAGELGGKRLFNGLYAEGLVRVESPEVLAVPRSAVLSPGAQPVVYVDAANGTYEPRKIKLGLVGDEFAEVLDGLKEGEKVVTNGNLLIDAETQISQISNQ
ncbi:MAG TPA: heavy metal-binding domain-containing protein [Verrucomicrobiae bacterium]|jgi:multidrug efflux pump subunit AcrA (membrane-fusion protein)